MKIHDLANKQFESIDEITTDIAESIIEIDEVVKEKERLEKEKEELQESVNSLKAKNLELLAMIPVVVDDSKEESETTEEIKIEDIYY
jgi:seryl-tRNA synthetase